MKLVVAALVALMGVAGAQERTRAEVKVGDAVPGHPGVTYETLLKQVLPDLARGDGGNSEIWTSAGVSLRDLEGAAEDTGPASFTNLQTLTLKHGGKEVLAVMAPDYAGNGWLAILAVYDMTQATPRLIDAANAGMDRVTALGTTLALSPDEGGITVTGWHNNSNENYETVQVVMLHEGKLISALYTGNYSLLICGMRMAQTGELTVAPEPASPYAALVYTVTQDVELSGEDCGEGGMELLPAGKTVARDVFHWDAAATKFVSPTNEIGKLMGPE